MDRITQALLDTFVKKQSLPSTMSQDKVFESFVNHIIFSQYNSSLNIDSFDTENTVGIDGCAVIINNQFVFTPEEANDIISKSSSFSTEFVFISSKTSASFDNTYISNLFAGILEIMDGTGIAINANTYVKDIIEIRKIVLDNALKMSENPEVNIFLCTTGTWDSSNRILNSLIERSKRTLQDLGIFSSISFSPFGAQELQEMYRKADRALKVIFKLNNFISLPEMNNVDAAYIATVKVQDFTKILQTTDNLINENIFYENVRDYQENNSEANRNMKCTLESEVKKDKFCLYNNGITVLARQGSLSGQNLTLDDYQIVNGCQTSNVIFDVLKQNNTSIDDILVPLKIVITTDDNVREDIIKSTNTQKAISTEQFLSLTKFSKELETFFQSFSDEHKLYYERRNGQYRSSSINTLKIIDQKTLIKISGTIILDLPDEAGRYPISFLKEHNDDLFQENHAKEPYYLGAYMYYKLQEYLRTNSYSRKYKNLLFYILIILRYQISSSELFYTSKRRAAKFYEEFLNILHNNEVLRQKINDSISLLDRICRIDEIDRDVYSSKKFREHILSIIKGEKEETVFEKS